MPLSWHEWGLTTVAVHALLGEDPISANGEIVVGLRCTRCQHTPNIFRNNSYLLPVGLGRLVEYNFMQLPLPSAPLPFTGEGTII